MKTFFEVLEVGPVVAGDEATGLLITFNGAYLSLWSSVYLPDRAIARWNCVDCRLNDHDMCWLTVLQVRDLGNEWLAQIRDRG